MKCTSQPPAQHARKTCARWSMKTLANHFLSKLIIITLLFSSCSADYLDATYRLTTEEKEYIPFSGGEKISYISTENHSTELISDPINVEIVDMTSGTNTNHFYQYETCETNLVSNNLKIRYFLNSNPKLMGDKPYLTIGWIMDTSEFISVQGGARVPMDTSDRFADIVELDSLKVSDKVYFEVFKGSMYRSTNDTATLSIAYPVYYYYALHYGVIRFDFSDSTSWELESIEW